MQLHPLSAHAQRIIPGQPLPFGIRDADGRLLLAPGQVIHSAAQLQGLLDRGAFVEHAETEDDSQKVARARPEDLPGMWVAGMERISRVLRSKVDGDFQFALDAATRPVLTLLQRDPDLAIMQVVRAEEGPGTQTNYAGRHAVHAAIACNLAARRLGWGQEAATSLFNAAVTMNLSVVDLQDRFANQLSPMTALQREALHEHPGRTVEMLQDAGISDTDWLAAVRMHHAKLDGSGYPSHLTDLGELALLLQRVDRYTASFAARVSRPAMAPDVAARQFYLAEKGDPMAAAIIKEFGIYPPGSTVRLNSGETGIVMKRGVLANAPIVAVVTDRHGDVLLTPLRRDCSSPKFGIAALIPSKSLKVRVRLEDLALACHR